MLTCSKRPLLCHDNDISRQESAFSPISNFEAVPGHDFPSAQPFSLVLFSFNESIAQTCRYRHQLFHLDIFCHHTVDQSQSFVGPWALFSHLRALSLMCLALVWKSYPDSRLNQLFWVQSEPLVTSKGLSPAIGMVSQGA